MTKIPDDIGSKLIMQGVHVELTGALQNAIREKFSVLLRHNEWIVRIHVRLHLDQQWGRKHHYTATGRIEIGGPDLIATEQGEDAYSVLDRLVEKLNQQLRDRHERRKDKRNRPHDVEIEAHLPKTKVE